MGGNESNFTPVNCVICFCVRKLFFDYLVKMNTIIGTQKVHASHVVCSLLEARRNQKEKQKTKKTEKEWNRDCNRYGLLSLYNKYTIKIGGLRQPDGPDQHQKAPVVETGKH